MYLEQFGLRERPFSSAPDPRFIYLGEHHEQALAHLLTSVKAQRGVSFLVGARGIGKTTLCRLLLSRLPERVDVALIPNPVPTPQELLSLVCAELGVAYGRDAPSLILADSLYRKQAAGLGERRRVVIVDEAQSLSLDVLEQLYLLSSLELDGRQLLSIILIGEPWLLDLLARAAPQRSPRWPGFHLGPFTQNETCAYVRHRLATAGGRRNVIDADALRDVHHLSSGLPGMINTICARALLRAAAQRRRSVDRPTVRAAARSAPAPGSSPTVGVLDDAPRIEPVAITAKSVRPPAARARRPSWPWLAAGALVLNAMAIGAIWLAPRGADVVALPSDARTEARAPTRIDPVDDVPRSRQPDSTTRTSQPDTAAPTSQPVVTAHAIAPPPDPPVAPAPSLAQQLSAPAEETPRQRRRRERAEIRSPATSTPVFEQVTPQELRLRIDMLVWAVEPRQRMVYVNGQKYVEGERLENGALLERIEENGIVLIQAGQRLWLQSQVR